MAVTQEDGGRLNAFAKEPRMEVMAAGQGPSRIKALAEGPNLPSKPGDPCPGRGAEHL